MPIVSTDIIFKLSTTAGTAGNSNTQPNVNQSLGGFISTSAIASGSLNNLFDNISGAENAASQSDYRCIFIHNAHPTLTLQATVAWLSAEVPGGADAYIGVDPAPASVIANVGSQAGIIAYDISPPAGTTFSNPTTKSEGVTIGDLPPGQCRALWIKRSANNSTALASDGVTIRVEGDTAA